MSNSNISELLSMTEAGKISGYHPDYLSSLARQGKINAKKVGRNWLISRKALSAFLGEEDFEAQPIEGGERVSETVEQNVSALLAKLEAGIQEKKFEKHAEVLGTQLGQVRSQLIYSHQLALREINKVHRLLPLRESVGEVHPSFGRKYSSRRQLGLALLIALVFILMIGLVLSFVLS